MATALADLLDPRDGRRRAIGCRAWRPVDGGRCHYARRHHAAWPTAVRRDGGAASLGLVAPLLLMPFIADVARGQGV